MPLIKGISKYRGNTLSYCMLLLVATGLKIGRFIIILLKMMFGLLSSSYDKRSQSLSEKTSTRYETLPSP